MPERILRESMKAEGNESFIDSQLEIKALSAENIEFLNNPGRRQEYERYANYLRRQQMDEGMPTFEQVLALIGSMGDEVLTNFRTNARKPQLAITPRVSMRELELLSEKGTFGCSSHHALYLRDFYNGGPKKRVFSVGLIDVSEDPDFLEKSGDNPQDTIAKRYDDVCLRLHQLGLRLPRAMEYVSVANALAQQGIILDKNKRTLSFIEDAPNRSTRPNKDMQPFANNIYFSVHFNAQSVHDKKEEPFLVRSSVWRDFGDTLREDGIENDIYKRPGSKTVL